jgi:hypothetical protein
LRRSSGWDQLPLRFCGGGWIGTVILTIQKMGLRGLFPRWPISPSTIGFIHWPHLSSGSHWGTDTILRRLTEDKAKQRRSLGYDLLDMANSIKARYRYNANWPSNCSDIRPSIDSLILKSRQFRIYGPSEKIYNIPDGGRALIEHFDFVGTYLSEDHFKVAQKKALELKDWLDRRKA